jgi:hypothetical protein
MSSNAIPPREAVAENGNLPVERDTCPGTQHFVIATLP